MLNAHARLTIVKVTQKLILLRDIGPWDKYPTITNDVEAVIQGFSAILENRRLEYYDSEGIRTQILVIDGKFVGFTQRIESLSSEIPKK